MAEYHFDATFSEPQVRSAIRSLLWHITRRELDWKLGVAIAIAAGALFLRWDDPAGWFEWALLGIGAFGSVFCFLLYRAYLRQSLERFRAMKTPVVHFSAQE